MKIVAYEVPDDFTPALGGYVERDCIDCIAIGKIYSSEDYKIITETEGDHMLFKVLRRSDI